MAEPTIVEMRAAVTRAIGRIVAARQPDDQEASELAVHDIHALHAVVASLRRMEKLEEVATTARDYLDSRNSLGRLDLAKLYAIEKALAALDAQEVG